MAEKKIFVGGEFLITEVMPDQVFTPEDYTEEHRMIYETAKDFVVKEIDPIREKIEAKDTDAIMGVLAKAGELGLLATDIPEAYGGLGLDKVSTTVVTEAADIPLTNPLCGGKWHRVPVFSSAPMT